MCKVNGRLTVYFEEPFWIGVFEKIDGGCLFAAKVTFGTNKNAKSKAASRNWKKQSVGLH